MTKRDFSYKTSEGVVMSGFVESEVDYRGYDPIDYARVCLTSADGTLRLNFSRDMVEHLGGQGQKNISEDLYIDHIDNGKVIARDLIDVSGGRPHFVDLYAAGEWGGIVREALASVGR